ncbi:hypothetical protein HLB23_21140 [Nocardia uniformis]|uniref:Uncharacterized protein n=1 Tax=Nocardia uniformis TaxID=53432 RepID=A0A849C0N9_9NOCA|nr:hypothetical protein [Nocardia uniformis]NNH72333.1 hypothetical protein [Nocardia uniformis]
MAESAELPGPSNLDRIWVGSPSFTAAGTVLFLNIVPVVVIPYLWVLYLIVLPVEVVTAVLLVPRAGAARQVGVGMLIGVLTSVVSIGIGLAAFNV